MWPSEATPETSAAPWELPGIFVTPPHEPRPYRPHVVEVVRNPKRWTRNALRRVIRSTVTNQLAPTRACRECGWATVFGSRYVQVERTPDEARFGGLVSCKNRWLCPVCAARRAREEGDKLRGVLVELRRRGGAAYLGTFTMPHASHDDIKVTRETVSKAWRAVCNGAPWKRFCATFRVTGAARALEVTHGMNGWHPHLHVLFFCSRPLSEGEITEARAWLAERWRARVERMNGGTPSDDHGINLKSSTSDYYIAKMGLAEELTGSLTKRGRSGRRTPWQIAYDIARAKLTHRGSPEVLARDIAIWKGYARGMLGAKQLTWTRGVVSRYQPRLDAEQQELDLGDRRGPPREIVLDMPNNVWNDWLRDDVRFQLAILKATERGCTARDLRYLIEQRSARDGVFILWHPFDRGKKLPVAPNHTSRHNN